MKNRKRALFLILLVVLLSGKSLMPVYAMETALHLPVEVVLEGDRPVQPETFVIQMKALTSERADAGAVGRTSFCDRNARTG